MAKIEPTLPIIPLSSIATILNAKVRNLKAYEDKGLLPKKESENKLYSIDDIEKIQLVHYLASVKRINASGIRYILGMMEKVFTEEQNQNLINEAEQALKDAKNNPPLDIPDTF